MKAKPILIFLYLLGMGFTLKACGDATFRGVNRPNPATDNEGVGEGEDSTGTNPGDNEGSDGETPGEDGDGSQTGIDELDGLRQDFTLPCTDDAEVTRQNMSGPSGVGVKVKGQLCPRSFGKLNVVLVLDFSGSMEDNDPRSIWTLLRCGRLNASRAILDHLEDQMHDEDDVRVSVVSFADGAQIQEPLRPLADVRNSINSGNTCNNEGWTNYKAAFDMAGDVLAGQTGNNLVYFLTDGMPTIGGAGEPNENDDAGTHTQAARDAMTALRARLNNNLMMNSVFLYANPGEGVRERTLLNELSGGPERVRLVRDADQLAAGAVDLATPGVDIQTDRVSAVIRSADGQERSVKVESFARDPSNPQIWSFSTGPFLPFTPPNAGETMLNTLTIMAPSVAGKLFQTQIEIDYTRE